MVQTQFSCTIKTFCSNNAMECKDKLFLTILQQNGTVSHHSCPYTSQQNGRAERKHRHILDTVRALLFCASLPERFWCKAALTAVYTISRIPSPTIHNKTLFELLHGKVPNYSFEFLVVFVLSLFLHTNAPNLNHDPDSVVFLAMVSLKKVIIAMIP
jgi:hypothetical protein